MNEEREAMTIETQLRPHLAAIESNSNESIDEIFEFTATKLKSQQINVAGFIQRQSPANEECCETINLENIKDGTNNLISQDLGQGSTGCKLDPQALAAISGQLLNDLNKDTDILIINRFGRGESEGQGFRSAIEKAVELNIPVLTAVRQDYKNAWAEFGGDLAELIPASQDEVLTWCLNVIKERKAI